MFWLNAIFFLFRSVAAVRIFSERERSFPPARQQPGRLGRDGLPLFTPRLPQRQPSGLEQFQPPGVLERRCSHGYVRSPPSYSAVKD